MVVDGNSSTFGDAIVSTETEPQVLYQRPSEARTSTENRRPAQIADAQRAIDGDQPGVVPTVVVAMMTTQYRNG